MNKDEVFQLIERHYRDNYKQNIRRYTRYTRSPHRAEDIVQEAYTRALEYWESCPGVDGMGAWFNTILMNCMKDNRKDEKRHGMSESIEGLTDNLVVAPRAIPAIIYNQVMERIAKKPADIAQVLELFLIKGLKQKEVSKVVLDKNPQAVADIVRFFRKEIKDEFRWVI